MKQTDIFKLNKRPEMFTHVRGTIETSFLLVLKVPSRVATRHAHYRKRTQIYRLQGDSCIPLSECMLYTVVFEANAITVLLCIYCILIFLLFLANYS